MILVFNKAEELRVMDEQALMQTWLQVVQEKGFRLTEPLRAIVAVLAKSERALDPVEIFDQARDEYSRLGLVTVYRTLEKLEHLGLIQRVHQAQGCHRYLRATQGHEHLLICSRCGQIVYFSGDDLSFLFDRVAQCSGYVIEEHWLQLFGICRNCQQAAKQGV
jgi:Fe2+ or Zn2+ uptake regulation protein